MIGLYDNQREAVLIGYLAGIMDGEGSFSIAVSRNHPARKTPAYYHKVTMGMVYKEIVELFQTRYGGSVREERVQNRRPIFRYNLQNREGIEKLLEELTPYLVEKKERAILLKEFVQHAKGYSRVRDELGRVIETSEEELAIREDFYQRMKELNSGKHPQRLTEQTPEKVK